jgi:hypothetical protein
MSLVLQEQVEPQEGINLQGVTFEEEAKNWKNVRATNLCKVH